MRQWAERPGLEDAYGSPWRGAIVPTPVLGSTSGALRLSARPAEALGEAQSFQGLFRVRLPRRCAPCRGLQMPQTRRHRPKGCPGFDFRGVAPLVAAYGSSWRGAIVPEPVPGSTSEAVRPSSRPTDAPDEAPSSQRLSRVRLPRRCAARRGLRMPRTRRRRRRSCPRFDFRGVAPLREAYGNSWRGAIVPDAVPGSTSEALRPNNWIRSGQRRRLVDSSLSPRATRPAAS